MSNRFPVKVYTFPNGMMIVFDQYGEQMPELQGPTDILLPKLKESFPGVKVKSAMWDGRQENPIVEIRNG